MLLKPHNKKAVDSLIEAYKTNRTAIYISGVGTGKSFVFMGLLDVFKDIRVLYVLPKHSIKENINTYSEFKEYKHRVDFVTFNFFSNYKKGIRKINEYDFVVVDEVHHIGSDRYGKCLLECMNNTDRKFLGLTATPIREKPIFDVSEYFDIRINGISNFDAIREGLMPPFEYRLCLPEKDLKQIEKEYNNEITARLDYSESSSVLQDIVHTFPRDKWICFFASQKAIDENYPMIEEVFKGYEILILLSNLRNLNEVITRAQEVSKCVIISVNILLEGVHLSSVDGIILFRNVTSLSAFQQMLGRVCSIGKKISPVIVDCSSCGPKLLAKLLRENNGTESGFIPGKNKKAIMSVGLGAHRAWEGIDKIMEQLSTHKTAKERYEENIALGEEAASMYLYKYSGKNFNTEAELREDKVNYAKATACCEKVRSPKLPLEFLFIGIQTLTELSYAQD